MDKRDEHEWRCRRCGILLGIERNGQIHIRHKRVQVLVQGSIIAVCPRCTEVNETGDSMRTAQAVADR